ncbi:hypothetical protein Pa4123_36760 [Phytohabitans aurantiacus]|uniref:Uncharacterized protein n=1 Tax=Phytohabitans aurantiacus TaxID=3016789 RepID=A0ABQ5QWX0_9ACTN|nr:hypothetical protein Pa4123_36760 [Phytohabitans aurantiacus]
MAVTRVAIGITPTIIPARSTPRRCKPVNHATNATTVIPTARYASVAASVPVGIRNREISPAGTAASSSSGTASAQL